MDQNQTSQMNPTPVTAQAPTLQLISISDLLRQAFAMYKSKFWEFLQMTLLSLAGYVPVAIIAGLFVLAINFSASLDSRVAIGLYILLGLLGLVAIIIAIYVYLIGQVGIYLLIIDQSPKTKVLATFKAARSLAVRFFETNIVTSIFLMLWFLLLIVPGIIMSIYYSLVPWIFIIEGLRNRSAMRRSKELIKGRWWLVFGRIFLPILIFWIISGIIFGIPASLLESDSNGEQVYSFFNDFVSMIIAPFMVAYSYYLYQSLVKLKNNNTPQA